MIATEFRTVVDSDSADARELLASASDLPMQVVADAMTKGAVWLRNRHGFRRLRELSANLRTEDELYLNYDAAVLAQTCSPAELVQDGARWSVWFKPGGMRSQGSKWGDHTTLSRFSENYFQPERSAFIVHRLDLAAQGLMLLAHDKKAAAHVSKQFAGRTVTKRYHAIVKGRFPADEHEQSFTGRIDGKVAHTSAQMRKYHPKNVQTTIEIRITTGRKHQIRRHLADAGFPIIGDQLYGGDNSDELKLCASYIEFDDPDSGSRVKIERIPNNWL